MRRQVHTSSACTFLDRQRLRGSGIFVPDETREDRFTLQVCADTFASFCHCLPACCASSFGGSNKCKLCNDETRGPQAPSEDHVEAHRCSPAEGQMDMGRCYRTLRSARGPFPKQNLYKHDVVKQSEMEHLGSPRASPRSSL